MVGREFGREFGIRKSTEAMETLKGHLWVTYSVASFFLVSYANVWVVF